MVNSFTYANMNVEDVILPVAQPGVYPLHTHFVPGVTANGVYLNPYGGALIVMSAE